MKYKPYSKYKDSGIEWLGEIPEEWELRKIKFLAKEPIKNGLGESAEFFEENWPRYIRITDIEGPKKLKDDTFCSLPSEIASGALVKKGDLLMSAVGATYGKSYLHLYDKGDFCYAGYLVKFSPNKELDFRYVGYWSESDLYWNQVHSNVIQSTIQNFSANKYQQLLILLPSLQEQIKIADYLDKKTERINAIIKKNKKQIELLKERRQAIISQAVTKGLNPKAKMKNSGIDWLGEIPERWETKKLKYIADITLGKMIQNEDSGSDILKPYVKARNILWEKVDYEDLSEMWFSELKLRSLRLERDDLLVSEGGEVGRTAIWERGNLECYFQNSVNRVRVAKEKNNPRYFLYLLEHFGGAGYLESIANRVSIAHLTREKLKEISVFVPSLNKQTKIVTHIQARIIPIDEAVNKLRFQNQKIEEYKKSLIHNMVTGKIMVI